MGNASSTYLSDRDPATTAAFVTQDYHPTIVDNAKLLILQPLKA
jgi:hypothetical protein